MPILKTVIVATISMLTFNALAADHTAPITSSAVLPMQQPYGQHPHPAFNQQGQPPMMGQMPNGGHPIGMNHGQQGRPMGMGQEQRFREERREGRRDGHREMRQNNHAQGNYQGQGNNRPQPNMQHH
jgi:hypothetical protein